ncbi:hypothetical protein ACWDTP_33270 [Mycobacterium sp. NPDC003449]
MAIRPLVTSGAALISAAALVAATPALFVPNDEVQVAASTTEQQGPKTLTVEQYQLLAIMLQELSDAFFQGYGGQIKILNGVPQIVNGELELSDGNCEDEENVCQSGLTGGAYYLIDKLLPGIEIDNVLFEGGFKGTTGYIAKRLGIPNGVVDRALNPQLTIDETIVTAAQAVFGPDSFLANLTAATFYGYRGHEGWLAAVEFTVDTLLGLDPPVAPDPDPLVPEDDDEGLGENARMMLTSATETEASEAEETGPGATNVLTGRLVNLRADLDAGAPKLPGLPGFSLPKKTEDETAVKDVTDVDTEGADEAVLTPVGTKIETPSFPKFQLPKPVFTAPIVPAPEVAPEPEVAPAPEGKPKFEAKIRKAETEDTTTDTGSTGTGNKYSPEILETGNGHRNNDPFGIKKNVSDFAKKVLGGGRDSGSDSGSGDTGSDGSGGDGGE